MFNLGNAFALNKTVRRLADLRSIAVPRATEAGEYYEKDKSESQASAPYCGARFERRRFCCDQDDPPPDDNGGNTR